MQANEITTALTESIDTIVSERLKSINFNSTVTATITDDGQAENGIYTVSDGTARYTAYSTDTTYKENDQVYVVIPNNDYREIKMIVGKKTSQNSNIPYVYKSPFGNLIIATANLYGDTGVVGLAATNKKIETSIALTAKPQAIPTTEIPFTRIGVRGNFKSELPISNIQGNYGVRLTLLDETERTLYQAALDCEQMFGNPYQFFTYLQQEAVFELPAGAETATKIKTEFFQNGNFNSPTMAEMNDTFSWIDDYKDLSAIPDLFLSGLEIYFGYDQAEIEIGRLEIYDSQKNPEYNSTTAVAARAVGWQWIIPGLDEARIFPNGINPGAPRWENVLVKSTGLSIPTAYWEKEKVALRWYHRKYGIPTVDTYAGSGWEPVQLEYDTKTKTFKLPELDSALIQEQFKAVGFYDCEISATELEENVAESSETKETAGKYEGLASLADAGSVVYSNVLTYADTDYEVRQTRGEIIGLYAADGTNGDYYYYDLAGNISDTALSSQTRELKIYYNGEELLPAAGYTVEWVVPQSDTMFQINDFSVSDFDGTYVKTTNLDGRKQETNENVKVKYKKISITIPAGATVDAEKTYRLNYSITSNYVQSKANNIIECRVYPPGFKTPYIVSKRFNFGLNSTSGTEVAFLINCERGTWDTDKNFKSDGTGLGAVIDFGKGQVYKITPYVRHGITQELIPLELNVVWDILKSDVLLGEGSDNFTIVSAEGADREYISSAGFTTRAGSSFYLTTTSAFAQNEIPLVLRGRLTYGDYENLTAYLSFAFRPAGEDNTVPVGPFQIVYDSDSGLPFNNYNTPYNYIVEGIWNTYSYSYSEESDNSGSWQWEKLDENTPLYPRIDEKSKLIPTIMYIDDLDLVSVRCLKGNEVFWSQPLLILKNKFPNNIINEWNGKLTLDEENNAILSAMVAAGKKDSNNKFSGVIMGDAQGGSDNSLSQIGLYGYHSGEQSFGFREDGTAFIGTSSSGRIEFDGTEAVVQSSSYETEGRGTSIDLKEAVFISKSRGISLDDTEEGRQQLALYLYLVKFLDSGEIEGTEGFWRPIGERLYENLTGEKLDSVTSVQDGLNSAPLYSDFKQKFARTIRLLPKFDFAETAETSESFENVETGENTEPKVVLNLENFSGGSSLVNDFQVEINGSREAENALAIGQKGYPGFKVDWNGNLTINGDFKITDPYNNGQSIFEVNKGEITFSPIVELEDKVNKLGLNSGNYETNNGYTFNSEGLTIAPQDNQIGKLATIVTNDGMKIYKIGSKEDDPELQANADGVVAKNLNAKNYLKIDNCSMFQKYEVENNTYMGCFWIED